MELLHQATVAPSPAACRSPLYIFKVSLPSLPVIRTQFARTSHKQALRLATSFTISGLGRLGSKTKTLQVHVKTLRLLNRSHFLLLPPGKFFLLAPSPPRIPLSFSVELTLSTSCTRSDLPLSRQSSTLAHFDSLPFHDFVILANGSAPIPFGKRGSGVLANCSLCSAAATLPFLASPGVQTFLIKPAPFRKYSAGLGSTNASAISLPFFSQALALLLLYFPSPPHSFYFTLWHIWKELSILFSFFSIRLQWTPEHLFLPANGTARELDEVRCSSNQQSLASLFSCTHSSLLSDWRRAASLKLFFNIQVPLAYNEEFVIPRHTRCAITSLVIVVFTQSFSRNEGMAEDHGPG